MKLVRLLAGIVAALLLATPPLHAQTAAPRKGAAEKSGKGWPYPEPAVPGATGASPDYADFNRVSERWDIYANLLWRRTASRRDQDYYDGEIRDFVRTIPTRDRARFDAGERDLWSLVERIRSNQVSLPHRDAATGCLFFMVRRSNRRDLAADDCDTR